MTGPSVQHIEPIDESRQAEVADLTRDYIRRAEEIFGQAFPPVTIRFDLSGRAAGMYRARAGQRVIRYNPHLFSKYLADNLANTVPHEVAHYVTDVLHGLHNIRPHGREWQAVMRAFAAEPAATSRYDLTGIPLRQRRRFSYRCACTTHALGAVRHNRARSGQARYRCRRCQAVLRFVECQEPVGPGMKQLC
ncbi:MAG: SprT-like domain-containing protein [Gammaproteobacteria bacterium]|jgi:SprT protein